MKFINRGPDETDITDENTVFSIDLTGHIHSTQIQNIHNEISVQTQLFHQISGLAEENDINITYLTSQIELLTARVTELEINNPS